MTDLVKLKQSLQDLCPGGTFIENCNMAEHTSFKCGGSAALFAGLSSEADLAKVMRLLAEEQAPYMFIGNGSNILFTDAGYPGVVIKAMDGFDRVSFDEDFVTAGAAVPLIRLARLAADKALMGLEFASGIPGSLGGAVFMNAGAYGGEMKNVIVSVRSMDMDGNIIERKGEDLDLSYRHSLFEENGEFILSAVLRLEKGEKEAIEGRMKDLAVARSSKQPLTYPSAGSFFKRPEGYFAGKLIEDSGLKGLQVGGAQVSSLHAGFVINAGGATATDVIDLMKVVQETVMNKYGVMLQPEVRIIGEY